jgi:preprotein translocase subunit SecE
MGKVRDDLSASKAAKPAKARTGSRPPGILVRFLANLVRADLYKPRQGWNARLYTGLALGLVGAAGAWQMYEVWKDEGVYLQVGVPLVFAAVFAWLIVRILQFPPFADFLIATEAEMNKVSWTSKDDLVRSTTVVLSTVLFMAVFLFVVDRLWTFILRQIGVLMFGGGGSFGSTA